MISSGGVATVHKVKLMDSRTRI